MRQQSRKAGAGQIRGDADVGIQALRALCCVYIVLCLLLFGAGGLVEERAGQESDR